MPELNALDRAWRIIDGLVEAIYAADDPQAKEILKHEARGAARVVAEWYGDLGEGWVAEEATARYELREQLRRERE